MTRKSVSLTNKMQKQVNELTQLFGYKTGSVIRTSCTGDWRGSWDYSVVFDDEVEFFIANGLKSFKKLLEEQVNVYKGFFRNKDKIMSIFKEIEEADRKKEYPQFKDLKQYTILDVDFVRSGSRIGWFYLKIQVGDIDEVIKHTETHLSYTIKRLAMEDNFKPNLISTHRYYTAGGLKENEVNYVMNSVGYSTIRRIYCVF